ncbi:ABC transporter substrate-binding protein [Gulosibacter hominis]|uniref:ABC transporter substrate-binding protein n=1 Tax=Gulosibacter hominis TaxID=2770504 RepID=UPI001919B405|nr:ABC transporter substrate-binding protein [Gulosibacter hominis]
MRTASRRPFFRTTAIAIAAAVGLASAPASLALATETAETVAPADPSTLRIATSGFVDSFNPFTSIYLAPTNALRYIYENLVQYSQEDGSPIGGLAESWASEEGGSKWVYTIREGMKWSDDEPITSEDVKWTYEQMMTNEVMGTANGSLVANFESVEAPDDHTFVINLKQPQAAVPGTEIPVVPEHIWSKIDDPGKFANDKDVVGSGPFILKSYSANQSYVLEANPNFWDGKPELDRIQYVYYTDPDASIQALRAGEIDLISGLSPTQYRALENQDGITLNSGIGRRYSALSLNPGFKTRSGEPYGNGNPALHDVAVRQAIRLAIDTDALIKNVMEEQATPATSFIPASYEKWMLPENDPVLVDFDPEAAKKKLDEAGWTLGSDGVREKDGKKLSLRLQIDGSSSTEQALSEYIKPWLGDVGIDVNVVSTDSDTLSTEANAANYDMYFSGWSLLPDPDYQLGINTCGQLPTKPDGSGGTSQDGYCNPEFDKLYAQQQVELDEAKRIELVHEMLAMNYEDSVSVVLYYPNQLEAYRSDRFEGFSKMPTENGTIANQAGYWGYQTVKPVGEGGGAGSSQTGLWVILGVVVVAGAIGVGVAANRRKKSADIE